MLHLRMLRHSDQALWVCAAFLVAVGLVAIFSATFGVGLRSGGENALLYVKRQFFSLLIGLAALFFTAYLDYKHLKKISAWVYALMLVLLLGVLFVGSSMAGAQRWVSLGFFSFQPSEFAKLMLIISAGAYLASRKGQIKNIFQLLPFLILIGIPFLLVFKQPDLGTALVFIFVALGMLAFAEVSPLLLVLLVTPFVSIVLRPFLLLWIPYLIFLFLVLYLFRVEIFDLVLIMGINLLVGLAFPFIWEALRDYQKQRILAFLNPSGDPFGAGYHSLQSKIAIGSGLLWGKGFLAGTQTQLQFIPIQRSDFIFAVVAEEFGFIAAALLLFVFALLVSRAFALAFELEDRDFFGALLAAGIGIMFLFQVFVNVGMAMAMLPVVGIPLPFISYGGSSLVVSLMAIGILQSIAMRRHKLIF